MTTEERLSRLEKRERSYQAAFVILCLMLVGVVATAASFIPDEIKAKRISLYTASGIWPSLLRPQAWLETVSCRSGITLVTNFSFFRLA